MKSGHHLSRQRYRCKDCGGQFTHDRPKGKSVEKKCITIFSLGFAKRANKTRGVYESDIQDLQANYECLWDSADAIMSSLANIRK